MHTAIKCPTCNRVYYRFVKEEKICAICNKTYLADTSRRKTCGSKKCKKEYQKIISANSWRNWKDRGSMSKKELEKKLAIAQKSGRGF